MKNIDFIETFCGIFSLRMIRLHIKIMDYISTKDLYEIRIASLISNIDKDVIIELYQPLVGSTATILYLTLLKQKRNEDDDSIVFTNEQLLSLMKIAPGNLLDARHALEAVGLLRTYEKQESDSRYYIYLIYAPKNPKEFFDDVLFKGLIIQSLGEKEAKRLAFHYRVDLTIPTGFNEISASFVDVFNPNYEDASFRKNISNSIVGHEVGRVNIAFNYDLFFKYIEENSQIAKSSFAKKDMREIERIAALFGLDEQSMAAIIIDVFNPNSPQHVNYARVAEKAKEQIKYPFLRKGKTKSKVSGDSLLAKKIRMMEETAPIEWLKLMQSGTKPASSDINIICSLSDNYGLSNGVINAIIDYVLTKNDNILSKNYCEKISSSVVRENIQTTVDAMNYLNKINLKTRSSKAVSEPKSESTQINASQPKANEDAVSDEEMSDIIASIEKRKKGGHK